LKLTASEPPAPTSDDLPPAAGTPIDGEPPAPDGTPADASTGKLKPKTDWWGEIKSIFWLLLAVLAFHSFIAKPFYIPSESMMPTLLKGDRLVVTKFPYGWSWVSPSFHILAPMHGRLFGRMPERGDVVIVTPPGGPNANQDYIKRVIGTPGDTIEVVGGLLLINGYPVKREKRQPTMIPLDANVRCGKSGDLFGGDARLTQFIATGQDGKEYCRLPVFRETLPNGRSYDTIDLGYRGDVDDYPKTYVPPGHLFLMGDNRDESADSRVDLSGGGLGGPVPWENIGGRAEFITFSLDGSSSYWNPISWITAMRGGRAGTSLHPQETASQ
jgi:signal peptidase I